MIQVTENIDFEERLERLKISYSSQFAVLPQNFFDATQPEKVFYNEELKTLKKLFAANEIEDIYCQSNFGDIEFKVQKSSEIILPSLIISGLALSQNPLLISVAFNILSSYAYDMLKGIPKPKQKVKLEIVIEKSGKKNFTKISFEGDSEGLKDLPAIINKLDKNERST